MIHVFLVAVILGVFGLGYLACWLNDRLPVR